MGKYKQSYYLNRQEYTRIKIYNPLIASHYHYTTLPKYFTGDAETVVEKEVLNKKSDINADVLKVGHHGSNSSSSDAFIKAVSPTYSVISVGVDNTYNHPNKEPLDTLKKYNSEIFRTDTDGTIVAISDGEKITMNKKGKTQQPNAIPTSKPATKVTNTKPVAAESNPVVSGVYITKTGEKYHKDGCSSLSKSKISIKLEDAKKKGYTDCSKCKP